MGIAACVGVGDLATRCVVVLGLGYQGEKLALGPERAGNLVPTVRMRCVRYSLQSYVFLGSRPAFIAGSRPTVDELCRSGRFRGSLIA